MPAEEPVLEVDLGLADEVVRSEQVPVEHADRQDGVLREGRYSAYQILWLIGICDCLANSQWPV